MSQPLSSYPGNDPALALGAYLAGRISLPPEKDARFQASLTPLPPKTSPERCLRYLSELCSELLRKAGDDGIAKALVDILSYKYPFHKGLVIFASEERHGPCPRKFAAVPRPSEYPRKAKSHFFLDLECSYSDLCKPNEFIYSVASINPSALLRHATEDLLLQAEMDPGTTSCFWETISSMR